MHTSILRTDKLLSMKHFYACVFLLLLLKYWNCLYFCRDCLYLSSPRCPQISLLKSLLKFLKALILLRKIRWSFANCFFKIVFNTTMTCIPCRLNLMIRSPVSKKKKVHLNLNSLQHITITISIKKLRN